jgi:hypothetical protein
MDRAWFHVALAILTVVAVSVFSGLQATDYVGGDNDDAMRLVEVRDLLAGQNWFDTTQYRLGLDAGTLMHWSRLVDLPIAALIRLFGLFLGPQASEAAALFVWPLLLIVPVVLGVAKACRNIGGRQTMVMGLVLIVVALIGNVRFRPGNIDHHNVQIALIALLMAGLTAPLSRPGVARGHILAGVMAGLAVAVGAETTPLIAAVGMVVALRWAWHGAPMASAAAGFGLALAATVTAAFLATTPWHLYAQVTCDNLSLGFFSIATAGGLALFGCARAASRRPWASRVMALGIAGIVVAGVALVVAPQCLQNPLASLDPLLTALWLEHVQEAQSITQVVATMPAVLGYGFAPGLIAILVCLLRIARNDRRELHLVFLALCLEALGVSMLQIRGTTFLNVLSVFPLSLAISDLRTRAHGEPRRVSAELAFAGLMLVSIPSIWALATVAVAKAVGDQTILPADIASACNTKEVIAPLAAEPTGVVAAPSNLGAAILRFTPHRVLAAPYHRNQAGMLAELNIGLASPEAAHALLKRDGVTLLAFCADDAQTDLIMEKAPDGLYAALKTGAVPPYLVPMADAAGGQKGPLALYRVTP